MPIISGPCRQHSLSAGTGNERIGNQILYGALCLQELDNSVANYQSLVDWTRLRLCISTINFRKECIYE